METISEGVKKMSTRKRSLTATTRRVVSELDDSYDDLISVAFLYADIADRIDSADRDRIKASMEWRETISLISSRIVEQSRREESWASRRPRAV